MTKPRPNAKPLAPTRPAARPEPVSHTKVGTRLEPAAPQTKLLYGHDLEAPAARLRALGRSLTEVSYELLWAGDPGAHWQVRSFAHVEALSQPYELRLELISEDLDADVGVLLGQSCELLIERDHGLRSLTGVVRRVESLGLRRDRLAVRIEVVPALRLLEQRVDTRLWQDISVPELVARVLDPALAEYGRILDASGLVETYPKREYVVQYRESDLAFVSRLLEDEGISYWFDHERDDESEVMVLEDRCHGYAEVTTDDGPELFVIGDRAELADRESLRYFEPRHQLTHTAVQRRVFDWDTPFTPIVAEARDAALDDAPARELYVHDRGHHGDTDVRALRELQRVTERGVSFRAASNVVGLAPGRRFTLAEAEREWLEAQYLVVSIEHRGECPEVEADMHEAAPTYENEFECIRFDVERPPRPNHRTPRPRIHGPQTAIVTGPAGEEIHTDEHGRIKVRFEWDREHGLRDDSSMWIRLAHNWAGPGFGAFFLPRIGMEVLVEFIDGDPDRPLVTGCVYDGPNRSSVELPASKTQTAIRTCSSPGGEGYNELVFEDAAGAEVVFTRAQRDMLELVLNDHAERVHANKTTEVGGNRIEVIYGAAAEIVEQGLYQWITVEHKTEVEGDRSLAVTASGTESYGTSLAVSAGIVATTSAPTIQNLAGPSTITQDATGITIAAPMITLSAGASTIVIAPTGITISGPLVDVAAAGVATVSGALVKIN